MTFKFVPLGNHLTPECPAIQIDSVSDLIHSPEDGNGIILAQVSSNVFMSLGAKASCHRDGGLPVIAVLALAALAILENLGLLTREGLIAIAIAAVAAVLVGVLIITPLRRAPNSHGTACFAAPREIRKAGLFRRGVIIGKLKGRLLRFDRPGHLLSFAPTRSGKGGRVIPNLLDYPGSVFVTDIKGENHAVTARHRVSLGPVHAIAPFHPDICNAALNPLGTIRSGTAADVDDARLIAEMLVTVDDGQDAHWDKEARTLLTGLLLYIVSDCYNNRRLLGPIRYIPPAEAEEAFYENLNSIDMVA